MKPIFMYLNSCKLSDRQLKKLVAAGYITIPVESFDSVKVCEPIIIGHGADIIKAAMSAIVDSGYESVCARFGRSVAKSLNK